MSTNPRTQARRLMLHLPYHVTDSEDERLVGHEISFEKSTPDSEGHAAPHFWAEPPFQGLLARVRTGPLAGATILTPPHNPLRRTS